MPTSVNAPADKPQSCCLPITWYRALCSDDHQQTTPLLTQRNDEQPLIASIRACLPNLPQPITMPNWQSLCDGASSAGKYVINTGKNGLSKSYFIAYPISEAVRAAMGSLFLVGIVSLGYPTLFTTIMRYCVYIASFVVAPIYVVNAVANQYQVERFTAFRRLLDSVKDTMPFDTFLIQFAFFLEVAITRRVENIPESSPVYEPNYEAWLTILGTILFLGLPYTVNRYNALKTEHDHQQHRDDQSQAIREKTTCWSMTTKAVNFLACNPVSTLALMTPWLASVMHETTETSQEVFSFESDAFRWSITSVGALVAILAYGPLVAANYCLPNTKDFTHHAHHRLHQGVEVLEALLLAYQAYEVMEGVDELSEAERWVLVLYWFLALPLMSIALQLGFYGCYKQNDESEQQRLSTSVHSYNRHGLLRDVSSVRLSSESFQDIAKDNSVILVEEVDMDIDGLANDDGAKTTSKTASRDIDRGYRSCDDELFSKRDKSSMEDMGNGYSFGSV